LLRYWIKARINLFQPADFFNNIAPKRLFAIAMGIASVGGLPAFANPVANG